MDASNAKARTRSVETKIKKITKQRLDPQGVGASLVTECNGWKLLFEHLIHNFTDGKA
jgi:DNA-directed RNA polymerase specialized sigma54-like protein